jgi:hypothetical protein
MKNQPENAIQEEYEEQIVLTKKDGVWLMDIYKDGCVTTSEGKELAISLFDFSNPLATTFVDGLITGETYNSLSISIHTEKEFHNHNCFKANKKAILNVLENGGLVLALSVDKMPKTEKLMEYVDENNITLPEYYFN